MKTKDFEKQIKEIDSRLEIVPNPNREGLSNIKLAGKDVCPVPSDEIKEESDPNYYYTFPNGMIGRHKSQQEAITQINEVLEFIKNKDNADLFFQNE